MDTEDLKTGKAAIGASADERDQGTGGMAVGEVASGQEPMVVEGAGLEELVADEMAAGQDGQTAAPGLTADQRALLDLVPGPRLIVLPAPDLSALLAAFREKGQIRLMARSSGMVGEGVGVSEALACGDPKAIANDLASGRLRTLLDEATLKAAILAFSRLSREALDGRGEPGVFLAMGALRWTDEDGTVRFAPLAFAPLQLVHDSVRAGYSLSLYDQAPQVNVALLDLLHDRFGVEVGGLDPLPQAEGGVDAHALHGMVARAVSRAHVACEVVDVAAVGTFPVAAYELAQASRALKTAEPVADAAPSQTADDLLAPLPLDADQQRAVGLACGGTSLAVVGAPGTGRTQLAAALAAAALGQGKRVLLVSGSAAALDQACARLSGLGAGRWVLRAFGRGATRAGLLAQLRASVAPTTTLEDGYLAARTQAQGLAEELDAPARELATANAAGLTLRDQVCLFRENDEAPDALQVPSFLIDSIEGPEGLQARFDLVSELAQAAKAVGDVAGSPLRRIRATDLTDGQVEALPGLLGQFAVADQALYVAAQDMAQKSGLAVPVDERGWDGLRTVVDLLDRWWALPQSWRAQNDVDGLLARLTRLLEERDHLEAEGEGPNSIWSPALFREVDPDRLQQAWDAACSTGRLGRSHAQRQLTASIAPFARGRQDEQLVPQALAALHQHRLEQRQLASDEHALAFALTTIARGQGYDWEALRTVLGYARNLSASTASELAKAGFSAASFAQVRQWAASSDEVARSIADALRAHDECRAVAAPLEEILGEPLPDASGQGKLCAWRQLAGGAPDDLAGLPAWTSWRSVVERANQLGLGGVAAALEQGLDPEQALPAYKRALALAMCQTSLSQATASCSFSGAVADATAAQYRAAERLLRDAAAAELVRRLAQATPDPSGWDFADGQEVAFVGALRRETPDLSLRTLSQEAPDVLAGRFPCLAATPAAAAGLLAQGLRFDLAVVDEATTLTVDDVLPLVETVPTLVAIGDLCDAAEGVERSLLARTIDLGTPVVALTHDHRGRPADLVAFAANAFYGGDLVAAPASRTDAPALAIQATAGLCGPDQTNEAEAQAAVGELRRRYNAGLRDPQGLRPASIGVVALTSAQRDLVEEMLEEACRTDGDFERWVRGDTPVLVVDAAHAQSLVRDTILVTCACAVDEQGLVEPASLALPDSWRGLCSALMRSRVETVVVSSLSADDIDAQAPQLGVLALRDLLASVEYDQLHPSLTAARTLSSVWRHAVGDQAQVGSAKPARGRDVVTGQLADALEIGGYTVERGVGAPGCQVDVAVVDGADSAHYLVGFIGDGSDYLAAGSTGDRELAPTDALEALGWRVMRLWALDWWRDPTEVVRRALAFIDEAQALPEPSAATPAPRGLEHPGPEDLADLGAYRELVARLDQELALAILAAEEREPEDGQDGEVAEVAEEGPAEEALGQPEPAEPTLTEPEPEESEPEESEPEEPEPEESEPAEPEPEESEPATAESEGQEPAEPEPVAPDQAQPEPELEPAAASEGQPEPAVPAEVPSTISDMSAVPSFMRADEGEGDDEDADKGEKASAAGEDARPDL